MLEAPKKSKRGLDSNFKRKIVGELINTGATAAFLARRHNINASQIYKWKKAYGDEFGFVPVSVTNASAAIKPIVKRHHNSSIKITIKNGSSITFEGDYDLSDILILAQGLSL